MHTHVAERALPNVPDLLLYCPRRAVLSRPSVTLMTSDHPTPAQKAVYGFWPGYFAPMGWGFGMSVRTRRTHLGPSVGSYGWPGFYGTAWYNDPAEQVEPVRRPGGHR